jgi:hypothetical protein
VLVGMQSTAEMRNKLASFAEVSIDGIATPSSKSLCLPRSCRLAPGRCSWRP